MAYEPSDRVRIQPLRPQEKAEYQVIDSINISHSDFYSQRLHLNQNLNSIIGGRSTGKSVLLGAIAKKLNSDKEVKFGNDEYTSFVNEVVLGISVTWKDGSVNDNRNIEYFPQSYMYRLAKNRRNELDGLVEGIIRQDPEKQEIISNYEAYCNENSVDITNKIGKLFHLREELIKHNRTLKEKGDEEGINKEVEKLECELSELKKRINISDDDLEKYNLFKGEIIDLISKKENIISQVSKIGSLKSKFFINTDIEYELVSLDEENRKRIINSLESLRGRFQKEWDQTLGDILSSNTDAVTKIDKRIEEIEKDNVYIKGIETFKSNKQYKEIEDRLKIQKNKLSDILVLKREMGDINLQLTKLKTAIKESHRGYYTFIHDVQNKLGVSRDKLEIRAKARFREVEYRSLLSGAINQQSQKGQEIVSVPIDSIEDYFSSAHKLFDLLIDKSLTLKGGNTHLSLCQNILGANQFDISYDIIYEDTFRHMSEGKKAFVILMLLLDFSNKDCPILIDQPEDDLDNRAIYKDLVRYLKNKKKERQIILVTHNPNIVVGADSELVIVANQNGVDTPNKGGSKFQYASGSLENTKEYDGSAELILESQGVKEHVCEILEGGNEAFKRREIKYAIK